MKRAAENSKNSKTKRVKPTSNNTHRAATTIQQWWRGQLTADEDPVSLQRFPRE